MNLPAKFQNANQTLTLSFCEPAEAVPLVQWAKVRPKSTQESDAIGYAQKIARWWGYYSRKDCAAGGLADILQRTKADPRAEVAICIIAKADWHPAGPVIGATLARRTWANSVFLDYLAAHPAALGENPALKTKGVGSALLYFVCRISLDLGLQKLWGEATSTSCTFYSSVFAIPGTEDLILAKPNHLIHFVRNYERIHGLCDAPRHQVQPQEEASK